MLTTRRLAAVVRSGRIRTVVLGPGLEQLLKPIVTDSGYRPVVTVGNTTIYQIQRP